MKYLLLKYARVALYTAAILAAIPPLLVLWKSLRPIAQVAAGAPGAPNKQKLAAQPPLELPESFSLPDGWRIEVPRHPVTILPIRQSAAFNGAKNPELSEKLKNHTLNEVLSGVATITGVLEVQKPFGPGLLIYAVVSGNVAKGVAQTTCLRLYTVLPEPYRTGELQKWADNAWLPTLDLAKINAIPFYCDGNTLFCVVANNVGFAQAWDWAVESARLKREFEARIVDAKSLEEVASVKAEMKKKMEEGYDLKVK